MKRINPVIKWSGSKSSQCDQIRKFFPKKFENYFEPFLGGGSVLYCAQPEQGVCGDICIPLIELWQEIQKNPETVALEYSKRWQQLQDEGYQVYYEIRDRFNKNQNPFDLLFLSRTCVNGLIRFNDKGEFNNSLHHTRPGISPDRLKKILLDWSSRIQNVKFVASDYRESTKAAIAGDLVYLDPPYFHTKGRYYGTIDFGEFIDFLRDLNQRGVYYILSYDGLRGEKDYKVNLPTDLYKRHILLPSGNSAFKKVIDKESQEVYESLYLNWE